jgi:hypothetical protein
MDLDERRNKGEKCMRDNCEYYDTAFSMNCKSETIHGDPWASICNSYYPETFKKALDEWNKKQKERG